MKKGSSAQRSEGPGSWEQQPVGLWQINARDSLPSLVEQHLGPVLMLLPLPHPCPHLLLPPQTYPGLDKEGKRERGSHPSAQWWLLLSFTHYCQEEGDISDLPTCFR